MKQLLVIILATFSLLSFAETSQPAKAPDGMLLAKKKDHSKDKGAEKKDATKSSADKKAAKTNKDNKSK